MVISLTKDEKAYLLAFLGFDMANHMSMIQEGDAWEDHAEDMELIKNIERKLKKG